MAEYREEIRCPKCNSTSLDFNKQGFGLKKAIVGGVLTGGYGLLAGFIGSNKVNATCLACGKIFNPKDGYVKFRIDDPIDLKELEANKLKEWDERNKRAAILNLSEEDIQKKFKMWDRLHEKGLISKEELEDKKNKYLNNRS